MRKKTKVWVPHSVKKEDLKLYLSFHYEHIKETDTHEEIEKRWKKFRQSLRDAVKGIVKRAKELQ